MTIHTLVLSSDTFSCNCNSIDPSLSKGFQEQFSHISSYCCDCIKASVFSNVNQFQFVQQCIQISTRINSSMYIRTSVFVSFETYPIFNNVLTPLVSGVVWEGQKVQYRHEHQIIRIFKLCICDFHPK